MGPFVVGEWQESAVPSTIPMGGPGETMDVPELAGVGAAGLLNAMQGGKRPGPVVTGNGVTGS